MLTTLYLLFIAHPVYSSAHDHQVWDAGLKVSSAKPPIWQLMGPNKPQNI